MLRNQFYASVMAASLIAVPVQRAQANDAAALLGGLIIGGAVVNEINKNKQRKRSYSSSNSAAYSAQRAQNRQVQTALNYFGYNVGRVDGSLGRNSRAGISRFQAEMGFPADGYMDDYERNFLLGSQQRALSSSHVPPYNTILASQGYPGLLRTYRNEQLGITTPGLQQATAPQPVPQPIPQPIPQPAPVQAVAPAPAPVPAPLPAPTQAAPVPARASTATLPAFTFGQVDRSVNEHCNEIGVLTAANGGFTTAGRVTDAEFALNEQFCMARTHAMAESSSIVGTIPNMTDAQVQAQCEGLAQVINPHIQTLSAARPDMVMNEVAGVLQGSGQQMAQLISGGQVCLGVGYRTDNAQMALASGVLLASAGQQGYGEMVSHQMREGFGTAKASPDKSGAWMSLALDAASNGAPVLGQSADRIAVLSQAISGGGGSGVAALPVFPAPSGN